MATEKDIPDWLPDHYEPRESRDEDRPELWRLYDKRVKENRDLTVLVTDSSNHRGTGKTTLSLKLADRMDRNGGLTADQVAIDPRPLTDAYSDRPKGDALVLDEAEEGMSKYRAGSGVNKAMRDLVSMGRYQEKYLVLNAPHAGSVDGELLDLVDLWVIVEERGIAKLYYVDYDPFNEKRLTRYVEPIHWSAIDEGADLHAVYQNLSEEKDRHVAGDDGDGEEYIPASEVYDMIETAEKEARSETRNEIIRSLAQHPKLTQGELGEAVDLSRSRVSQIVNGGD